MDEYIDSLLREERVCDCILPRIQKRMVLEEGNELDVRISALDDDMDMEESSDEEGEVRVGCHSRNLVLGIDVFDYVVLDITANILYAAFRLLSYKHVS